MSDGMNRVFLLGSVSQEPDYKQTQTGLSVLTLKVITCETWLDKNKELQERQESHDVVMFGARAEVLAKTLMRDENVFVEGTIRTSGYDKQKRVEIVARDICAAGRSSKKREVDFTIADPGEPITGLRGRQDARSGDALPF